MSLAASGSIFQANACLLLIEAAAKLIQKCGKKNTNLRSFKSGLG